MSPTTINIKLFSLKIVVNIKPNNENVAIFNMSVTYPPYEGNMTRAKIQHFGRRTPIDAKLFLVYAQKKVAI